MTVGKNLIHKLIFLNIYLSISCWHWLYSAALIRSQHIFLRKEVVNTSPGAQTHESYVPLIMFLQASFCQVGVIRCKWIKDADTVILKFEQIA